MDNSDVWHPYDTCFLGPTESAPKPDDDWYCLKFSLEFSLAACSGEGYHKHVHSRLPKTNRSPALLPARRYASAGPPPVHCCLLVNQFEYTQRYPICAAPGESLE